MHDAYYINMHKRLPRSYFLMSYVGLHAGTNFNQNVSAILSIDMLRLRKHNSELDYGLICEHVQ
jgi:hypothetical protein